MDIFKNFGVNEIVAGLRDLAQYRKFQDDGEHSIFKYDYAVCMAAAKLLETNKGRLKQMKKEPVKTVWKQMMPIPDQYTVRVPVEDENGNPDWFIPEQEGWAAPCLVLYENIYADGEVESGIGIYVADDLGEGDLDLNAKLVLKGFAGKCVKEDMCDVNYKIAGTL